MKLGKLNWDDLRSVIDKNKGFIRDDVRIKSSIGEDCSVVNFGEYECVLSTDPITGASSNIGRLAVHINANDIGSSGAQIVGFLVTILAPPTATLDEIKVIMEEINEEALSLKAEILGGHTEITDAVNRIVVSITAVGKGKANSAISSSGANVNDDIVITKDLCIEGSLILVNDYKEKVIEVISEEDIIQIKGYFKMLSVVKEGIIAGENNVSSMHDITEGGILGALWEMAEASHLGFKIYEDKLPISKATKKLCSHFKIDPMRFISSGSMVITTRDGEGLKKALEEKGVKATIIGKIDKKEKILICDGKEIIVSPPENDELFNISL